MPSSFGARHGLPGYDKFRTGLSYDDVKRMLWDESQDSADWRYKRRGTVLGLHHQLKLEMYNRIVDEGRLPELLKSQRKGKRAR